MFKDLLPKVRAFLIGTVILAVASGVAVVAAAFGVYAVLIQLQLSVPISAAITAVVFAVVAAIAALVLRGVFSSKGKQPKAAPARNPEAMQMGMEAGAAVIGLLTDLLASRKINQRAKAKSRRSR
jgi:predicted MFS family arabinose efflux permease